MTNVTSGAPPTCFIISPIGPDGSDVRTAADDVLELLVQPTLAEFDFEVVRADRMSTPTVITTDIVQLVHEAELCIIDLTGHNANVFYECGRRHETGKPFIQMVAKEWEERIPFDVAGIRTITYDLSTPRSVLQSQQTLREFVASVASGDRAQPPSGASITTVAEAIQRLERKLDAALRSSPTIVQQQKGAKRDDPIRMLLKSPRAAFLEALRSGDVRGAFDQLDRLKQSVEYREYLSALGIVLAAGDERARGVLEGEIESAVQRAETGEKLDDSVASLVQTLPAYANNFGLQKDLIEYVKGILDRIPEGSADRRTLAQINNAVGMMAWTADFNDVCADYSSRAMELNPSEESYVYNLALAYGKSGLNDSERFEAAMTRLERFDALSPIHVRYLAKFGRTYSGTIKTDEDDDDDDDDDD